MTNKKIVVAPDKFKGSLEAEQVGLAIKQGILAADSTVDVVCLPMADGGEGTVDAMVNALQGEVVETKVNDPFFRPINCYYGISADRQTAFIEMAKASGILLLAPNEYDTKNATTYGTGELIAHALSRSVKQIYLGIGGSATTDAGIGMLSALGFEFFDQQDNLVEPIGNNLSEIASFSDRKKLSGLDSVDIVLMTDVSNPFYGKQGAAHVFARQKGASPEQITKLDAGLRNFAQLVLKQTGKNINAVAGSGAGGGIAGGAVAGIDATIRSGAEVIMDLVGLKQAIAGAALVVTGEGKVDVQTLSGKVVKGVVDATRESDAKVAIFCGINELSEDQMHSLGGDYIDSIMAHAADINQAMENSSSYLTKMAFQLMQKNSGGV